MADNFFVNETFKQVKSETDPDAYVLTFFSRKNFKNSIQSVICLVSRVKLKS